MAAGRDHPTTQQSPPHARRAHALEHDGIAHAADGDDSPPDRGAGEQAAGGFDLRELGHRAVVYDEIPARGPRQPSGATCYPATLTRTSEDPAMARMTGGEAIVKALAREGVQVAFGLPGVQLYGIVTAFRDEPLRFITVRHEGSSSYMADGYARAGGGIGLGGPQHRLLRLLTRADDLRPDPAQPDRQADRRAPRAR